MMVSKAWLDAEATYEAATGRQASRAPRRVARLVRFLEEHTLTLEQVKIEHHYDERWSQRRTRTERERLAICLGSSAAKKNERWWVVPR